MCCCSCQCEREPESDTPAMWDAVAEDHRRNDRPISAWYAARVADHLRFYIKHTLAVHSLQEKS